MPAIHEIADPFERYCAFLIERDLIYQKKSAGKPWPWTNDRILQEFRFTEVYRERDKTSLHYQKTIRDFYKEDQLVLPATVLYRWFNRIETCEHIFNQMDFENQSIFESYIADGCERPSMLWDFVDSLDEPHVTGAFIINGMPGYRKSTGVILYFHEWCKKPWEDTWKKWLDNPPMLKDMYEWLRKDGKGLGTFMAAQLVADLKHLPFMKYVPDWWTFAAPGPGSMRGLNVVCGRLMHQSWKAGEWEDKLLMLNELENKALEPHGLGPFHAQDTQNHCCEFSKYTKAMLGTGRPRQVYSHV